MVFGEITTRSPLDFQKIIRDTIKNIGYDDSEKGFDYKTFVRGPHPLTASAATSSSPSSSSLRTSLRVSTTATSRRTVPVTRASWSVDAVHPS